MGFLPAPCWFYSNMLPTTLICFCGSSDYKYMKNCDDVLIWNDLESLVWRKVTFQKFFQWVPPSPLTEVPCSLVTRLWRKLLFGTYFPWSKSQRGFGDHHIGAPGAYFFRIDWSRANLTHLRWTDVYTPFIKIMNVKCWSFYKQDSIWVSCSATQTVWEGVRTYGWC